MPHEPSYPDATHSLPGFGFVLGLGFVLFLPMWAAIFSLAGLI